MGKAREQEARLMGAGFVALMLLLALALLLAGVKLRGAFEPPSSGPVVTQANASAVPSVGT